MKNKKLLVLLPALSLLLTSCGDVKKWDEHLEDYVAIMQYHNNFNILQLTDIHWNVNTSTKSSKDYLAKVLEESKNHIVNSQGAGAKIDLVEITGDAFMLANSYAVRQFIDYFEKAAEEYGFLYTIIWGNHDMHGLYNPNWLGDSFRKAAHCIYIEPNDNLYGRSNFVISLTDNGSTNGNVKWQIFNLDSGASFSETAISPFRDYDYIRKDQTQWYVKAHKENVPTIAYYHIPQDENEAAWVDVKNGANYKNKFFKLEGFADNGNEEYASDFIDVAKDNGLKAAFMGHAHNVDWTVLYQGVVLGLGVKTGTELYFAHIDASTEDPDMKSGLESVGINENFDLIGASLVTLTSETGDFDLEHLYLNERASGDFVRWVKW